MCKSKVFLLTAAAFFLICGSAQAQVSHGYSEIFIIDTVTSVEDGTNSTPQAVTLATIYPNPFNPSTMIVFELAEAGPIELAIYDLGGRLVRVMESGIQSAGRHEAMWNGLNNSGQAVPTGTYLCQLRTPQGSQTRKLTLAR